MLGKKTKQVWRIGVVILVLILIGCGIYFIRGQSFVPLIFLPVADKTIDQVVLDIDEKLEKNERQIYLKISTAKTYPDGNYTLRADDDRAGGKITVELLDVRHLPGLATQAVASASYNVELGNDAETIQLEIVNADKTDYYTIVIKDGDVELQTNGAASFSSIRDGQVDRFEDNELNISCDRYNRSPVDEFCDQFFTAIEKTGALLQEDKGGYFRVYLYDGSLNDFTSILDEYDDYDHTLRITSSNSKVERLTHPCVQILDSRAEAFIIQDQTWKTITVPQYNLNVELPDSWYVLDRPGDVTIYTDKCGAISLNAITLSRDEFITSRNPQLNTYSIETLHISDLSWEKRTSISSRTNQANSSVIFIERNDTIYYFDVPEVDSTIEETVKQIVATVTFR